MRPTRLCYVCLAALVLVFSAVNATSMGPVLSLLLDDDQPLKVDAVFFAQTHVQEPDQAYFGLVSDREALIKAHVVGPRGARSPEIEAVFELNGEELRLPLSGPTFLPQFVTKKPGQVQHSFNTSFTAMVPKEWVKPGLSVSVVTPEETHDVGEIHIGAPNELTMTMFDVHFFRLSGGGYPLGWEQELEAKWPVAKLTVNRIPNVVFEELVVPYRRDAQTPVVRVNSKEDYFAQTGKKFDGEQAATGQWNRALQRAAGRRARTSYYYTNIYGVGAGGQAGGFAGVGNGNKVGILHHESGHAFSLPHWGNSNAYPYKGDMLGIAAPNTYRETHAGPTWAFDLPSRQFIPPTVQPNVVSMYAEVGVFKADPMQGGGSGDQEQGYIFRHFSDYSVNQIRNYLQRHLVRWNPQLNSYAAWDQATAGYTQLVANNGVSYPVARDVSVISVMASISAASRDGVSSKTVSMIYPPIGPYLAGLIELYDPSVDADRQSADNNFCPDSGCDVSFRVTQGGATATYMVAASWDPTVSPLSYDSLSTQAINLPASNGSVSQVELLLTPDAEKNGLPNSPTLIASWQAP